MRLFSSFILLIFGFGFTDLNAQYYNNSNNELSYQLYEQNDNIGKYRVFIVIVNLTLKDNELIEKWNSIPQKKKIQITENWANEGKRIEVERFP